MEMAVQLWNVSLFACVYMMMVNIATRLSILCSSVQAAFSDIVLEARMIDNGLPLLYNLLNTIASNFMRHH